jgi:hypothetical protein
MQEEPNHEQAGGNKSEYGEHFSRGEDAPGVMMYERGKAYTVTMCTKGT